MTHKTIKGATISGKDVTHKTYRKATQTIRELAGDTIFSVVFIKRTTGELREMQCRLNCSKDVKGGERSYDPAEKSLLVVYDTVKLGWRSIPVDAIQSAKIRGITYNFSGKHEDQT